ncbi:hypothetical protein [Rhodococcoides yunnanense]|uniref:hypothetical protein n=1 Tax=Rhodococcoides yunnanense TaxID=278209 RepID=UPI001FE7C5A7|nr:hypothetical protein [Rhodococcus yunnanensis]
MARTASAVPAGELLPAAPGSADHTGSAALGLPERVWLFGLGAASSLPLMNFTVTGFSFVCVAVAFAYFLPSSRRRNSVPLLLAALGSCAYLASAWVNETSFMAPNVFAFASFGLYFCGITVLARDIQRIATVLIGIAFGSTVFFVLIGTFLTSTGSVGDLWKYGIAPAATVAVLYLAAMCRVRWQGIVVILTVLAAMSLILNFRSHALVCLAVALLLVLSKLFDGTLSIVTRLVTLAAFGLGFSWLLSYAARDGLLGESLRDKVLMQSSGSVPMLLAGRTEPPLSITAILHRPWLGWGDANNISHQVYLQAQDIAMNLGFARSFPFAYAWKLPDGTISLHSILLVSWAEAGILAALLPLWLLWACYRLIFVADAAGPWTPLLMFLGMQATWDILFSPWSYNLPAVFAVIACSCISLRTPGRHRMTRQHAARGNR